MELKSQSNPNSTASNQTDSHIQNTRKFYLLNHMQEYFSRPASQVIRSHDYNLFSIIDKNDKDRLHFTPLLHKLLFSGQEEQKYQKDILNIDIKTERAIASLLGLAICDAFGASTQFTDFDKQRRNLVAYDFLDIEKQVSAHRLHSREGYIGVWTDDCSMALSLADSLLLNQFYLNPQHSRFMYHMWLKHGLNNGGRPYSIGLGGNISISTREFAEQQQDFTQADNGFNNGNGSLMRLAPIPINFYKFEDQAMKAGELQSRTTHNGQQAKQCCRLMTLIIVRLINRQKVQEWKEVIEKACDDFETDVKSVKFLAMSSQQSHEHFQSQLHKFKDKFRCYNKKQGDRNWNWKDPNFTYSQTRADSMPGYVGSYCMDALAMALHTVWHGKSFHQIALVNTNMGGDCDTVGAIAGQISGAIYGIDGGMLHLYSQLNDAKYGRFQVFLKAYKLATHSPI